ncbi:uncharacterized protein LOC127846073 [Dreissena polymorpha]|uniref:uncharacterized protein LOC127846073 n=1 Tax=Dreissena polymorpha TaxID=45954 RepID=UPI002264FDDD|nr:uncharacterized protein LOC127846073 [Dreissena polymorpha]
MDARTYLVFGGLLATISSSANGSLLEQTGYRINILEDDVGPTVDALMNLCNKSPPGSLFAVYSVSGSDTKSFNFTKTDENSCNKIFEIKLTLTKPISSEVVKKNIYKCVPFLEDPSMFNIYKRIIIYMVSKKTNVQLTKMNFNTFVLVTDDLTNPDLWKDIATDREHVISVKERDKLLKLLERDTRFGKCPLDKFFTDHIGYCQDCSDELDSLPEECYYYGQRMKPPIPETTSPTPDYTTSPTPDYTWILYCSPLLLIFIVPICLLYKRWKSRNELKKASDRIVSETCLQNI